MSDIMSYHSGRSNDRRSSSMSRSSYLRSPFILVEPAAAKPTFGKPLVFTGPDNIIRHQRVSIAADHRNVGIGYMSPEGTADVSYVGRASSQAVPAPRPKSHSGKVGEIGWGVYSPWFRDAARVRKRWQIKCGEFRQAAEDQHTHKYQVPWYPPPPDAQKPQARLISRPQTAQHQIEPKTPFEKRPSTASINSSGYRETEIPQY